MAGAYLGETIVDVAAHPKYSKWTAQNWAMLFLERYGQIDGAHHKNWVLDQVARILNGTLVIVKTARWADGSSEDRYTLGEPSEEYLEWRQAMLGEIGPDGEAEYDYDEGIAP